MSVKHLAGAACAAALLVSPALAGEQQLKFRLVTKSIGDASVDVVAMPGHWLATTESVGVAIFEDGRIAYKDFVDTSDGTDDTGTFFGYSTYTFENGDSLTAKFVGEWSAEGLGGDYEVLSGTGAYAGATGTGRFDKVDAAWDEANLMEGSFTLDVPGS